MGLQMVRIPGKGWGRLYLFLLWLPCLVWGLDNRLENHPSPYLALHAEDPVGWQPWDAKAFASAQQGQRLVFVSVGYFACHWCHVMQRESFRDPAVAAILAKDYVAIKVDRELRPALDRTLMEFVERSQGVAGWPLNVILTPDGEPLVGFLYQPREALERVLSGVAAEWSGNRDELKQMAARQAQALTRERPPPPPLSLTDGVQVFRAAFLTQANAAADPMTGGFGDQSKFPSVPQLGLMLRLQSESPDPDLDHILRTTLRAMATQGLRDQLDGGFFRYTVDPNWQTPHFEKMLYDNALLAELYRDAALRLGDPAYARVARDTLNFLDRRFAAPGNALVASFSAVDTQDVEGGYYLWSEDTLSETLDLEERAFLGEVWGMEGVPPFDAGYLPILQDDVAALAEQMQISNDALLARLESARVKLLAVRAIRGLPVDDKRLAGWNGMALLAFSRGASSFGEHRYRTRAKAIRDDLVNRLWDGQTLARARSRTGEAVGEVDLEDYAWAVAGLTAWAELTNEPEDLALSRRLALDAWSRFHGAGGWRASTESFIAVQGWEPALSDGPIPAASAVLIEVSLDLAERLGDARLYSLALDAARRLPVELADSAFFYASHIGALMRAAKASPSGG